MKPGATACKTCTPYFPSLTCPNFGHTDHTKFGGDIISLPKVSVEANHRRCIENDAAALLDHLRSDRLPAIEDAFEIDGDDEVKIRFGHLTDKLSLFEFDKLSITDDACVVDDHIDASVFETTSSTHA